jgi:hypothetical protein
LRPHFTIPILLPQSFAWQPLLSPVRFHRNIPVVAAVVDSAAVTAGAESQAGAAVTAV